MENLRLYLNSLSVIDQKNFAERCGTSLGYLRKAISIGQEISAELAINIEAESNGVVIAESLLPNVRWHVIRGKQPQVAA